MEPDFNTGNQPCTERVAFCWTEELLFGHRPCFCEHAKSQRALHPAQMTLMPEACQCRPCDPYVSLLPAGSAFLAPKSI